MRARTMGLMIALALGCGDDVTQTGDEGSSSGTSTQQPTSGSGGPSTSGSTTQGPTSGSTTTEADSSSGTGFEPPDPACGNGFVEDGEECDDANDDNEDGCTAACALRCGLEWSAVVLPPTDTSIIDARDVDANARGGAAVGGFLREITTDQRGNETILDDEGIVVRISPDGETLWTTAIEVAGFDAEVTGVAMDDAGNVYVSVTVGAVDDDGDIRLYKLDPLGAVLWFSEFDSAVDTAEDSSFGVAIGGDGNPVITGQVRVAVGDNDVWVASYDAASGDEIWTSTWSGESNEGFSTDSAGPMSIGVDGTVYLYVGEYVDFQTRLATVLAFDGAGGAATEIFSPEVGIGGGEFVPMDVSAEPGGTLLLTSIRLFPGENTYHLERVDLGSGEVTWAVDGPFFEDALGARGAAGFTLFAADPLDTGGVVVSGLLERSAEDATWVETWVARFDETDAVDCTFVRESPQLSFIPGSLFGRTMSAGGSGQAVVAAQEVEGGLSIWIGAFRPD
ncbi:MAG: PQQ-binding-like beta-propeller repeat protein [Nannocystaceae bacterium]|nr:PQQ-binding-like beta-propeller repeat protein [Nannocystaceae bacterium]